MSHLLREMELFDLQEALMIFCNSSTRQFLMEYWGAYKRIETLNEQLNATSAGFAQRGDLIAELNNRIQSSERMAEDRLMRIKQLKQTIADREEDIRKLKMQIIELEQRNERLNTIVEAKRGVEQ